MHSPRTWPLFCLAVLLFGVLPLDAFSKNLRLYCIKPGRVWFTR